VAAPRPTTSSCAGPRCAAPIAWGLLAALLAAPGAGGAGDPSEGHTQSLLARWGGIEALISSAATNDALLPAALRQLETWAPLALADPRVAPEVERGWALLGGAFAAAGARVAAECVGSRSVIALAHLLWLRDLARARPRLSGAADALESRARSLRDFEVGFTSEIEAPDRFFGWGRGRARVRARVRLPDGAKSGRAAIEEEFTYPIPDRPDIDHKEIGIENDPELRVEELAVRLEVPAGDVFVPSEVGVKPVLRLGFRWPEERVGVGFFQGGGMSLGFALDPTRMAFLGFWATHFDELHAGERDDESFRIAGWEVEPSGDPVAVRRYVGRGPVAERTIIELRFVPKP
jgi:hypothetical protein